MCSWYNGSVYTYADMPDKTIEGIKTETSKGLAVAAFYFETTLGVPAETFGDWLAEKCPTAAHSVKFYMNFRNKHADLPQWTMMNS